MWALKIVHNQGLNKQNVVSVHCSVSLHLGGTQLPSATNDRLLLPSFTAEGWLPLLRFYFYLTCRQLWIFSIYSLRPSWTWYDFWSLKLWHWKDWYLPVTVILKIKSCSCLSFYIAFSVLVLDYKPDIFVIWKWKQRNARVDLARSEKSQVVLWRCTYS